MQRVCGNGTPVTLCEELDQYSGMEEVRSLNQSLLRGGHKFWEFCSYNPPKSMDSWVNSEQIIDDPDRLVHHSTYLDVPKNWLGKPFFDAADKLKERSNMLYRHEYLGEVTGTGGAVFENVEHMDMPDAMIAGFDKLYYGLDFGFAVDPLAFVAMSYDKDREILYIFDEIYEQKLRNADAVEKIRKISADRKVVADSAEPRTINEFRNLGLSVYAARKGPDSVDHGIKWMQNLEKIYIDRHRCPNAYREFMSYEYDRNKDGQFISSYPDADNHCLVGDTMVDTVQGKIPIRALAGKKGIVYCYDGNGKCSAVGNFHDCRMTRENAEVVELVLADGRRIKATSDHPVLTQRGWRKICELNVGNDYITDISHAEFLNYVRTRDVRPFGRQDVYNMEVDDFHNFSVSNGLIVHNCIDAARYGTEAIMRKPLDIHSRRQSIW